MGKTAIIIYNEIMNECPKIDTSTPFKQYLTANKFNKITSLISFEEMVWFKCNPNKELANEVMDIASKEILHKQI
ncbi:hypothetical protein [uncultured Clostridium sp.]|uniref:hypothetical protein n=1 Tax=uncultured Clostridium sp. TaxID=59620 RepID=UPI00260C05E6|nr:hypothetical protein [uncultured Clostridium sp.]